MNTGSNAVCNITDSVLFINNVARLNSVGQQGYGGAIAVNQGATLSIFGSVGMFSARVCMKADRMLSHA